MEKRLIFRVPDRIYEQVNKAVKDGKAKNPSELVRLALTEFLKNPKTETQL
jgi:Arc/MetJ-type ribon-helix-helix transcriptional regulator